MPVPKTVSCPDVVRAPEKSPVFPENVEPVIVEPEIFALEIFEPVIVALLIVGSVITLLLK